MPSNLHIAKQYAIDGFSVVPLRTDGSKAPKIREWRRPRPWYQVSDYWGHYYPAGIGIICGAASGNLEVLDFDDGDLMLPWTILVEEWDVSELGWVMTPRGGWHIYYRTVGAHPGTHLALSASGKVLIETRAEGHQVVAPGSPPSVHPLGTPYVLHCPKLVAPVISDEQRSAMLAAARSFNEYVAPEVPVMPKKERPVIDNETAAIMLELYGIKIEERAGDKFNRLASWEDILVGWRLVSRKGTVCHWRRPGGCTLWSATTGHCGDKLHVFSTSAAPLEANKTYSKFAAWTTLRFGGDWSQAAKNVNIFLGTKV